MSRHFASLLGFSVLIAVGLLAFSGGAAAYCGDYYCDVWDNDDIYCPYECAGGQYNYCDYDGYCEYGEDAYGCAFDCSYAPAGGHYCDVVVDNSYDYVVDVPIYTSIPVEVYCNDRANHMAAVDCGPGGIADSGIMYNGYYYAYCRYTNIGPETVTAYVDNWPVRDQAVNVYSQAPDYGWCGDGHCAWEEEGSCITDCGGGYPTATPRPTYGPTPTATPMPPAECWTTSSSTRIKEGFTSQISSNYRYFRTEPGYATIKCGTGSEIPASCSGGKCTATCMYPESGEVYPSSKAGTLTCAPTTLVVSPADVSPACSRNSDCGTDQYTGAQYCRGSAVYRNYTAYACIRPNQPEAYCSSTTEPRIIQTCANGCSNGQCNGAPTYPSCAITAYPDQVTEGGRSVMTVSYYQLPYAPNNIQVNCGNGQSVNAVGCGGTTGSCTAGCTYNGQPGNPVTASASGVACSPAQVTVVPANPTQLPHTPRHYYGDASYERLYEQDSVTANNGNGVIVSSVFMGGQSGATFRVMRGGTIVKQVTLFHLQPEYFDTGTGLHVRIYNIGTDPQEGRFIGFFIRSESGATASPTPPANPACALTAVPAHVQEGGTSSIVVNYYNLPYQPNAIPVECGNLYSTSAVNCFGTTGSCAAQCFYANEGSFPATAIASGAACTPVTVTVAQGDGGSSDACRDGTRSGECSNNKPYFCDEGFLVKDAQTCGCNAGYQPSGSDCIASIGSCSVSLNPQEIQPDEPTTVIVSYRDMAQVPDSTVYCGDGATTPASCSQSTPGRGSCTATCAYDEENNYPKTYTVNALANGIRCSAATAKVVAPDETKGRILFRITSCEDGSALQGAKVSVGDAEDAYADEFGQAKVALEPGTYTASVSKQGYSGALVTKTVEAGRTATASVCLEADPGARCDIDARLARTPAGGDAHTPLLFQINVTNYKDEANIVLIDYSSAVHLEGPSSVQLQPLASTLVSVRAYPPSDFIGDTLGMVTLTGNQGCAKSVALPINVIGGLVLQAGKVSAEAMPGERACFPLTLRNSGPDSGIVVFSSTPLDPDDGGFEQTFDIPRYSIAAYEIKDGIDFCVRVPSGADDGGHSFALRAQSPISDAGTVVKVEVGDTEGGFDADTYGCLYVRDWSQRPIQITNDVADGDYTIDLQYNDVGAAVTPQTLYNFRKGTTRTVYFSVDPESIDVYERHLQLLLLKGGSVVMERDICLRNSNYASGGGYYDGGYYGGVGYSVMTSLSQSSMSLARGSVGSTTLQVTNDGGITDSYLVSVEGLSGRASPSSFTLRPNEKRDVQVSVTANANPGTYTVPVKIYSARRQGYNYDDGYHYGYDYNVYYNGRYCDRYYYDGGYHYENCRDYYDHYDGYGTPLRGGSIDCGNGRTVSVDCRGSSGTCMGTCEYGSARDYTVTADVGDVSCDDAKIKVVGEDARACQVGVESFVRPGTNAKVTVMYRNLNDAPADGRIQVLCGNGNVVDATGCHGTTGECTASCYYSGTGGYVVSASGETGCGIARITVGDDGSYCSIDVEPLAVEGRDAEVRLHYRGVEYDNNNDYYYNPYSGYSNNLLLKTENLVVTIGGGGVQPTATPSGVSIGTIVSQDIAPGGSGVAAVTLKNNANAASMPVTVFFNELPAGVIAEQAEPVTLLAYQEKIVRVRLHAQSSAEPGTYRVRVSLEQAAGAESRPFDLDIVPASEIIEAEIRPAAALQCDAGYPNSIIASFLVKNNEARDIGVSGLLAGLPEEWHQQSDPLYQIIKPGEEKNIDIRINTTGFEPKDYPAVFEVRQRDGRRASTPYDLPMAQCGGGLLSGLFVLNTSFSLWQLLVMLLVLAVLAFLFFSTRPADGEQRSEDAAEAEESQKNLRQLTLNGIKEEVSEKQEPAKYDWSPSSDEAYLGEPGDGGAEKNA
ncbi:MAG: hypothetical protein V1787_03805 [Candidatus Micrarchaeota archaeon]